MSKSFPTSAFIYMHSKHMINDVRFGWIYPLFLLQWPNLVTQPFLNISHTFVLWPESDLLIAVHILLLFFHRAQNNPFEVALYIKYLKKIIKTLILLQEDPGYFSFKNWMASTEAEYWYWPKLTRLLNFLGKKNRRHLILGKSTLKKILRTVECR